MDGLLYEFCGNESFLNGSLVYEDVPTLSHCFQDTFPIWISCGYLWVVCVPFTVFLVRSRRACLPYSITHIVKMATCLGLACMAQLHFTFRQMYGDTCTGLQIQPYSGQTAMWIKFATFMCSVVLLQIQKNCGIRTSGVPFTFWLLMLVTESLRLYSYVLEKVVCGTQIVFYVYYCCICVQFVLHCFAEKDHQHNPNKVSCPMDEASVLNRIYYHWFTSTIYSVYKKRFSRDKMWLQTVTLRSSIVGPRLYQQWQKRLQDFLRLTFRKPDSRVDRKDDMSTSFTESSPLIHNDDSYRHTEQRDPITTRVSRPSLLLTVLRTFTWEVVEFSAYGLCSFCLWFLIPIVLRLLLDYVDVKASPDVEVVSDWVGGAYVAALCVILELSSVTCQTTLLHSMSFGLKVKSALMYIIYKKALTVSRTHHTLSVGEVSSLMSVDCQRIQDATMYSYYILLFGIAMAGFTWQITEIVGVPATVSGLLVLCVFVSVNVCIVYRQSYLQTRILLVKALRIRVINEVLTGIKVLKMYAWEPTFQQKIEDIRQTETKLLRENTILLAIASTLANHAQYLVHFVMIAVYLVTSPDQYISSSVMFVSLSLVIVIKYVVSWLPSVVSGAVQVIVLEASNRIGGWMNTLKTGDGAHFELGPHSIRPVGPQGKNTLQLIDEIGLADDVIGVPATNKEAKNRYLYVNGDIHALPNADKLMNLFKKSPPFSKSVFSYMRKERTTKGDVKDDETIYDFFARRFGPDVAEYGVDAFCRGIFAGDIRKLSIKSCFPPIYNLEKDYGGIIRGTQIKAIQGFLNNKKPPEEEVCELYKKARSERWSTYTFRHGCQQLPDRLLDVLTSKPEVDIHMNTPCSAVTFKENCAEVTINGEVIKADHVVSSIFAKDTGVLLESDSSMSAVSADLKSIPGVDVAVVCLEYEGTGLVNKPGFGHLLPSSEDTKLLGVIYDSCMFPQLDAPNKQTTRLTAMMGGAWYADLQEAVPSMSEAELGQFAARHVASQLGFNKDPTKIFVGKHAECIPQYVLGHSDCIGRIFNTIKERRLPLSLVGSSYKGPSINDCINNTRLEVEDVTGRSL